MKGSAVHNGATLPFKTYKRSRARSVTSLPAKLCVRELSGSGQVAAPSHSPSRIPTSIPPDPKSNPLDFGRSQMSCGGLREDCFQLCARRRWEAELQLHLSPHLRGNLGKNRAM
jgi:hypothetical protein